MRTRAFFGVVLMLLVASVIVGLTSGPFSRSAGAATIPAQPAACTIATASTGKPVVTSFLMTPSSVNVATTAKKVAFSVTAVDASTVIGVSVYLASAPSHAATNSAVATLRLTKGSAASGTWTGSATIAKWSRAGAWQVQGVYVVDAAGGVAYYRPSGGFANASIPLPWPASWPHVVHVTSVSDVTPPVITSVALSSRAVHTVSAAKKVGVRVVAKDSGSGVAYVGVTTAIHVHGHPVTVAASLKRVTGSAHAGIWRGTLVLPGWAGHGTQALHLTAQAWDVIGNQADDEYADLVHHHLTSALTLSSKGDNGRPTLKSLALGSASIDATAAGRAITVSAAASDALSGVSSVEVVLTSPSGLTAKATLQRVAGTGRSGAWRGTLLVPRCGEPGRWALRAVVSDVVGNTSTFSPARLASAGQAYGLTVKDLDTVGPKVHAPAHLAVGDALTLTFSEHTLWAQAASDTLTVSTSDGSPVTGSWTCSDGIGQVACDAAGAAVTTAAFVPDQGWSAGVYRLSAASSRIYDMSGNPMPATSLPLVFTAG